MSELVLLHHNEPMTTSETLADGVELQHKNVVALIRKHAADLAEWGEIAFQTRLNLHGKPTEFAWLNEGQSLFLLTLMKNSPVVVAFKKALVKAFLELRDRMAAAPVFTTRQLDHGADLAVAADRTFRSFLRTAKSAGLALPVALRIANAQTRDRTGLDMLAEIGVDPDAMAESSSPSRAALVDPLRDKLAAWLETAGPGPWRIDEILEQALGVPLVGADLRRVRVRAGPLLRAWGFIKRHTRTQEGQQVWLWGRGAAWL